MLLLLWFICSCRSTMTRAAQQQHETVTARTWRWLWQKTWRCPPIGHEMWPMNTACENIPEMHFWYPGGKLEGDPSSGSKLEGDSGSKCEGDSGSGSKLIGYSGSKLESVLLLATRCHAMNTACKNIPWIHACLRGSIGQSRFVCQFWCTGIQGISTLLPRGVHRPKKVRLPNMNTLLNLLLLHRRSFRIYYTKDLIIGSLGNIQ